MRKELKTTTVYFADDGKMFERKEDCERYEQRLAASSDISKIEKFPRASGWFPPDNVEHMSDLEYLWYRPKTKEELDALIRYYNIDEELVDPNAVGKIVCVEHDIHIAWLHTLDDCLEYVRDLLSIFGMHMPLIEESSFSCADTPEGEIKARPYPDAPDGYPGVWIQLETDDETVDLCKIERTPGGGFYVDIYKEGNTEPERICIQEEIE